jgi:hypothetical protein
MATPALLDLNQVVTRFLLKYKLPLEDAVIFTEHAANCLRDFHLYDSPNVVSAKIAVSALGIIEMPSDMVGFNGLFMPLNGELWSFTEKDTIVNTTTFTGGVEGQDSDFGEGVAITDPKTDTYGGVGGVNDYYYTIDWKARRIFCEGIVSDTVLLKYTTSGVETAGTTYIPEFITPMLDSYMLWKASYFTESLMRQRPMLEKDYERAEFKIRNLINSMSYAEWRDLFLGITTQAPMR